MLCKIECSNFFLVYTSRRQPIHNPHTPTCAIVLLLFMTLDEIVLDCNRFSGMHSTYEALETKCRLL